MVAIEFGTVDWKTVKDMDLLSIMTQEAGNPVKTIGNRAHFNCPVHSDKKTPSLVVYTDTNTWHCYGGCGKGGDVFDWFAHRYDMKPVEVYERLTGNTVPHGKTDTDWTAIPDIGEVPTWEPTEAPVEKKHKTWTPEEVMERTRRTTADAEAYFMGRGITRETVNQFLLGQETKEIRPTVGDWTWDGDPVKRQHYTIPNIFGGVVRAVKCRRDDRKCRQMLGDGSVPDLLFQEALEALHGLYGAENVTEADLINVIFGGRFDAWWGGDGNAVFNQRLVCDITPEGVIIPKQRSYILINEAEINAMYFRDIFCKVGYPAIALHKSKLDLKTMLSGVERIIIIKDNDDNGAGENLAQGVRQQLGRGEITIPPVGKDANDCSAAEVRSWMDRLGVQPLPRYRI